MFVLVTFILLASSQLAKPLSISPNILTGKEQPKPCCPGSEYEEPLCWVDEEHPEWTECFCVPRMIVVEEYADC